MKFNNICQPIILPMPDRKPKPPRAISAERGDNNYEVLKGIEKELHNISLELKNISTSRR